MLFIASEDSGWLKLDGAMVPLAADRASTELPYLSWSRYAGSEYKVELDRETKAARSTGPETETAPGKIVIRDRQDRELFADVGSIDCGA